MKNHGMLAACLAFCFTIAASPLWAQEDRKGCTDPQLFTRVAGFYINDCRKTEFDTYRFIDPATKREVQVEGRLSFYHYRAAKESKGQKSMLQIARNYTAAIEKIGGTSLMTGPGGEGKTWMKLVKDGKETWAALDQNNWKGSVYHLYIVE